MCIYFVFHVMKSFYEFCGSSTWIGDFSLRKTTTTTQTCKTKYMKSIETKRLDIWINLELILYVGLWAELTLNVHVIMCIDWSTDTIFEIDRKWVKPWAIIVKDIVGQKLRHFISFTQCHVDFSEGFHLRKALHCLCNVSPVLTSTMVMTSFSVIVTLFFAGVNYRFCVSLYDVGGGQ